MVDLDFFETLFYKTDDEGTYVQSSSYFDSKIEKIKTENKNIAFKLAYNKQESISKIIPALEYLKEKGVNFSKVLIAVEMDLQESYLTTPELEKIIEVEDYIKTNGGTFAVYAEELFTLDEIIIANQKLEDQINYINSLTVPDENNRPLNEFEKFLMAYNFCTNFKYNENEQNKSNSRNITSIMNSDSIVCVGYAKLLQEMCHRLGIECFKASLSVYDKNKEYLGGHQNNIVALDGKLYYADACWDCVDEKSTDIKGYNYCLIPMEDRNNLKSCNVEYAMALFENLKKERVLLKSALKQVQESENEIDYTKEVVRITIKYKTLLPNLDRDFKALNIQYDSFKQRMKLRQEFELKQILKYINKYEYGEAFSYDDFYNALYNIGRAEGMDSRKAEIYTTRTMEENEKNAHKIFTPNASNCFAVGRVNTCEL